MKQRIVSLLLNPFIIALYISIAIIIYLPESFSKYKVEIIKEKHPSIEISKIYYYDFDNDGVSERIEAQTNTLGNASILYYHSNGDFGDQINFTSKWPSKTKDLWFSDIDLDKKKEVFLVTQRADSAFLTIIDPFTKNGISHNELFVDTISPFNGAFNFIVNSSQEFFGPNRNNNEVIFSMRTGFAANPRHIYKYDVAKKIILKSPHLVNSGSFEKAIDIDNDGKNEILIRNHASGNKIDSIYTKRSDSSTWLQVLDDDLQHLFKPIEFKTVGAFYCSTFFNKDKAKIISFFRSNKSNVLPTKLMVLNLSGNIENEISIPFIKKGEFRKIDHETIAVFDILKDSVHVYSNNLVKTAGYKLPSIQRIYQFDILNDNTNEWLILHSNSAIATIYDYNFENHVTFSYSSHSSKQGDPNIGLRSLGKHSKQLFIQNSNYVDYVSYLENPIHYLQYGVYSAIYLGVLGLVFLVLKGQSLRENKKRAIEKQISELQIKTIKNQVDPHFVFNAINTISEMTLMDNKLEADKFISKFSQFMRDTLQHSDKITTTLKEELEYTENFIKLQQIRFNNIFSYEISVEKDVVMNTKIPKHVLFTYVENAIKHGLRLKENGKLKIGAKKTKDAVVLSVEDNGVGMITTDTLPSNSTGNGLLIMKQIFKLYTKLHKKRINHKILELKDNDGNKAGVRVDIEILN